MGGIKSAVKSVLGPELSDKIHRTLMRRRHAAGTFVWPTKSFEVWLLLQTELYLVRPKMLVEFGSGRSTSYLAEYAFKMGGRLISIEEHAVYTKKVNQTLKDSVLPDDCVHHLPVRDGWYDRDQVTQLLHSLEAPIDFILLDGPSAVGPGDRGSQSVDECVVPLLKSLKMAVVDDVHRPECDASARHLADTFNLSRHDARYGNEHAIAFLHSAEAEASLERLPVFLSELVVPGGIPCKVGSGDSP